MFGECCTRDGKFEVIGVEFVDLCWVMCLVDVMVEVVHCMCAIGVIVVLFC